MRTLQALRRSFIYGLFLAALAGFIYGGLALDAEPCKGCVICLVSLALGALIYVQNVGGSLLYDARERRSRR